MRKQKHARILLQCDECRENGGRTAKLWRPLASQKFHDPIGRISY